MLTPLVMFRRVSHGLSRTYPVPIDLASIDLASIDLGSISTERVI